MHFGNLDPAHAMSDSNSPSLDNLALRTLHGLADEGERVELARLLGSSPESRRRFLDHAMLHGMLAREAGAGAFAADAPAFFRDIEHPPARKKRHLLGFWLPAAAAGIAACVVAFSLLPTRASAALERVIQTLNESHDRTYRIEVIEPADEEMPPRADRGRFPPANFLDGARLWLRGPGEFVLSQSLPNGQSRVIGSDGGESWSLRGGEAVRVSPDPERFGRAIFARSSDLAFLDLRTQIDDLKPLYQIEWLDHSSRETWKLIASRRSADHGGPREVELWFHPETGLLQRMILRHLPRGNSGPRSVAVILESTAPLPADFFSHGHHHEPGRTILTEP